MNTTAKGTKFEDKVYDYFSSLVEKDEFPLASKKYSKIFKHQTYSTTTSRKITLDLSIETYNSLDNSGVWSSLVAIECKNYGEKVDIGDFDEFEAKLQKISPSGIKAIFVSTIGFSQSIIEEARQRHISLALFPNETFEWIVPRDIERKPEDLMPILWGQREIKHQPIVYADGKFCSLYNLLTDLGVCTSEESIVSIPFIKDETLDAKAKVFYSKYEIETVEDICKIISKEYPDYTLLYTELPEGVLGTLSIKNKTISISKEIEGNPHRSKFTLAHELGHLVLHEAELKGQLSDIIDDKNITDTYHPIISDTMIERMEYQANAFASYLLLPPRRFLFVYACLCKKERNRRLKLTWDNQLCNNILVNHYLSELSQKFNVSKLLIKIRLEKEGLLQINNNPRRIRNI